MCELHYKTTLLWKRYHKTVWEKKQQKNLDKTCYTTKPFRRSKIYDTSVYKRIKKFRHHLFSVNLSLKCWFLRQQILFSAKSDTSIWFSIVWQFDNSSSWTCPNIAQCTIGIGLRLFILILSVSSAVFFSYNSTFFAQFLIGRC